MAAVVHPHEDLQNPTATDTATAAAIASSTGPQQQQQQQPQQQQQQQPIRRVHSRLTLDITVQHETNDDASNFNLNRRMTMAGTDRNFGDGDGNASPSPPQEHSQEHSQAQGPGPGPQIPPRTSHMYVLFSIFVAFLAIVSPPGRISHSHRNHHHINSHNDHGHDHAHANAHESGGSNGGSGKQSMMKMVKAKTNLMSPPATEAATAAVDSTSTSTSTGFASSSVSVSAEGMIGSGSRSGSKSGSGSEKDAATHSHSHSASTVTVPATSTLGTAAATILVPKLLASEQSSDLKKQSGHVVVAEHEHEHRHEHEYSDGTFTRARSGNGNGRTLSDIIPVAGRVPKQKAISTSSSSSQDGENEFVPMELHKMFGNLFGLIAGTGAGTGTGTGTDQNVQVGNSKHHVKDGKNVGNKEDDLEHEHEHEQSNAPMFVKWILNLNRKQHEEMKKKKKLQDDKKSAAAAEAEAEAAKTNTKANTNTRSSSQPHSTKSLSYRILEKFVDPSLLQWIQSSSVVGGVLPLSLRGDANSNFGPGHKHRHGSASANSGSNTNANANANHPNHPSPTGNELRELANRTATQIIDKILTSTPRILTIVNLLLAVTYLLHSIVADFFLGHANANAASGTGVGGTAGAGTGTGTAGRRQAGVGVGNTTTNTNPTLMGMNGGVGASSSERINRSGRERLGGYLLFKLLLIAAVVKPDTLDLLILLSWYTLLAFLRSLSYLAGITTAHTAASGQSPHKGVLNLLLVVLVCDASAAATCAALFHGAGWGMVILLTCDCGLLALDVFTHLARYAQQVLDERHQQLVADLETMQNELYEERDMDLDDDVVDAATADDDAATADDNDDAAETQDDTGGDTQDDTGDSGNENGNDNNSTSVHGTEEEDHEHDDEDEIERSSRQIDREIERLERVNERRLAALDNTAFSLELIALLSTISHFLHVWTLHGVTLNLVDGVLALHLHSALSAFGRKIAERRNHNRIVRDLDEYFDDASDMELMKANAAGDVCCICLCSMSMGSSVKKLSCGHLYHTHCLREVVERARSIEAARCPLCRASVVDGKHVHHDASSTVNDTMPRGLLFGTGFTNMHQVGAGGAAIDRGGQNNNNNNDGHNNDIAGETQQNDHARNADNAMPNATAADNANVGLQNQNERALFRLSTEGIIPTWIPIPAFSFEIVRRFPPGEGDGANIHTPRAPTPQPQPQRAENDNNVPQQPQQAQQGNPPENSIWRRFLSATGMAPLSPEELATATAQLIDMFPQYQYNEAIIMRELRLRGSIERVAEAILTGQMSGPTAVAGNDDDDVNALAERDHGHVHEGDDADADISERERIRNETENVFADNENVGQNQDENTGNAYVGYDETELY